MSCSTLDVPPSSVLPGGCPAEEAAVLTAVASLGYPVATVDISPYGFPCGTPFWGNPPASIAPGCPVALDGPTAYVTFLGTDKVAALLFTSKPDGSIVASVVGFRVPSSGPMPA